MNQHLSHLSLAGDRKYDCPPSFSEHSPWWRHYKNLNDHFSRLSVAMSVGEQINDILEIEPTTTIWMYYVTWASRPQLWNIGRSFQRFVTTLEKSQSEDDLGAEQVISDYGSICNHRFKVGQREYSTVVIPPLTENLNKRTFDLLKEFAKANQIGTILVVGSIVAKAAGKYLDGEIDGSGFISEIGHDGLSMISGMLASKAAVSLLGGATGLAPMAVPVLAAMVASAACSEIYSRAQKVLQEHRDNLEIQQIADSASMEIAQQKIELKRLMGESHAKWVDDLSSSQIITAGLTNKNVSQTNDGLCQLMSLYHISASLYQNGESVLKDLIASKNGNSDFHLLHC